MNETMTAFQRRAAALAAPYQRLPMQEKMDVLARTFGRTKGAIRTTPCRGDWRGTSDVSVVFDGGTSLFLGNRMTPKAKTKKAQNELLDAALLRFNPDAVQACKDAALPWLLKQEAADGRIAREKGLTPYTVLNVELSDGSEGYLGWYYVTLAVGSRIHCHLETHLNAAIMSGEAMEPRENYFVAGSLKDADYVFSNVGFSTASYAYSLPMNADTRKRAEKTLAERLGACAA